MAADHEIRVVPSVLDRLIDQNPRKQRDARAPGNHPDEREPEPDQVPTRKESVQALHRSVLGNLDELFNSRNTFSDLSPDFVEAGQSVLTYGLPDLSGLTMLSSRDQNRMRQAVETAIRTFEPRLTAVVVTVTPPTPTDRTARLRVEARLIMDPSPESVTFDIVRPLHTSNYEVKERE